MDRNNLPKRYRIVEDYSDGDLLAPVMVVWYVVRKTPAGAWIIPQWATSHYRWATAQAGREWSKLKRDELRMRGARYVLDGAGKRYAHETEELARDSYRRRKLSQLRHAKAAIETAEHGLAWLKGESPAQSEILQLTWTHPPFSVRPY